MDFDRSRSTEATIDSASAPPPALAQAASPAALPAALPAGPLPAPAEITRIRASSGWRALDLAELWRYRELLYFLALRDIKLRYKQTALGVAWVVLQPLLTMAIFSMFLGQLLKSDDLGDIPYPLFTLVGLLPWQLFAYSLTQSSNSLVAEQRLITKVYFPRLLVPLASVMSGLADFGVTFGLVLLTMVYYAAGGSFHVAPSWNLLALPLLVVFVLAAALAVGLWLAALNVQFRDVKYTVPFLTQIWMIGSPVVYPSSKVPEAYRTLYGLNPMAGVIEGFRWALLGKGEPPAAMMWISALSVAALLISGLYYFRRLERIFADVV
jgi:lipopolysaccharide transport system permease protein